MKRKIWKGLCALVLVLVFLYGYLFHDISRIKGQELLLVKPSPSQIYTAKAYLAGGGVTSGYGILVKVQNNVLGGSRNIYWKYPKADVRMRWKDEWRLEKDRDYAGGRLRIYLSHCRKKEEKEV